MEKQKVFELLIEREGIKLALDLTEHEIANIIVTAYEEEQLSLLKEICARSNEWVIIKLLTWLKE